MSTYSYAVVTYRNLAVGTPISYHLVFLHKQRSHGGHPYPILIVRSLTWQVKIRRQSI